MGHAELLIHGRIATLAGERGFGWAEALAIGDGRVLAAGAAAEVDALAGPGTKTWRLAPDELVMPAITDAHLHLMSLVVGRAQVDLSAATDIATSLELLAAAHRRLAAAGDSDGWLLGHGWSPSVVGGWPTSADLARACPGRPVALWSHDHHSRWLSAEALRRAGIERSTPDPAGGVIRRDEHGEPTGILHEQAAGLVDAALPEVDATRLEADLRAVAAELAALGVTGAHDPAELDAGAGIGRSQLLYRELAAAGRLPLRVHASIRAHQLDEAIGRGLRSGEQLGRYRFGWMKLFVDGALGSRSALLLEPYTDANERPPTGGPRGMYQTEPAELAALLARAWAGGISA
ncbi:MAG TPA: amidohydrolase family protein, partial [Candidatus Limnocylindrales bacterium]